MTRQFLPMASPFVAMRPSYQNRADQFVPLTNPPVPVKFNFINENVSQNNKQLPNLFGKDTTFAYTVKKYFFVEKRKNAERQKERTGDGLRGVEQSGAGLLQPVFRFQFGNS